MESRWDTYFMEVARAVALKSPCHSRKIGALIVRDRSIISTGYNGPPRGFRHCEECPRKPYGSGQRLDLCPAAHAEANCIVNAARIGASTLGATLYLNTCLPCKNCMALVINAGIKKVVTLTNQTYDKLGLKMAEECGVEIRCVS